MSYHIVGLTLDQFFATGGSTSEQIMKALWAASWRTMQLAARSPADYPAKTVMEVRTMASFERGGLPEGYDSYAELFLFNNPVLAECRASGMNPPIIREIQEGDLPPQADVLSRLPLYLHRDIVANIAR